jgi:hypothetical protein
MIFTVLSINWTGQALSGEQLLVLRNVAAKHMNEGRKNPVINFSHELCEGHVTRGKTGTFGMFGGTFFKADLGTVNGEPWTVDFMLPRGSEELVIDDGSVVISTRPLATGEMRSEKIDHHAAAMSGDSTTIH